MTEKQVSVRIAAVGGKQLKAELKDIGAVGDKAFKQVGQSANGQRAALQNMGYQVQDVFVQVAGGTSVSRALSQQLPQLLSGFGLWGVAIGTVVAALGPLLGHLIDFEDKGEVADKAVKSLTESVKALQQASSAASATGFDIFAQYGDVEQAREVLAIQREIADTRAKIALGEAQRGITGMFGEFRDALKLGQDAVTATDRLYALGEVADLLGIAFERVTPELEAVASALSEVETADGPVAAAEAMGRLRDAIYEATDGGKNMTVEAANLLEKLSDAELAALGLSRVDLASNISAGADEAARLAKNLTAAASVQGAGFQFQNADGTAAVVNGQIPISSGASAGASGSGAVNFAKTKTSRGGGGGGSPELDIQREAARVYEQTRTEAEKYAIELAKLNKLEKAGAITAETHARAVAQLGEKYLGVQDAATFWKETNASLKDSILDLAVDGVNSFDAIGRAIKRAALEALLFGTGPLMSLFSGVGGGGGLGGIVRSILSFDGGGHTGNGARSGGMDGRGGFLAMLHPRERVTDLTKGGGAGGGFLKVAIDVVNGNLVPLIQQVSGNVVLQGVAASAESQRTALTSVFADRQARGV